MKYSIGDTVWIPVVGNHNVKTTCPVCFGKKSVVLILGDDTHIKMDCGYCGNGYDPPRGFVEEYRYEARVEFFGVTGMEIQKSSDKEDVSYRGPRNMSASEDRCFSTREDAMTEAEKIAATENRAMDQRIEHIKKDKYRSFSWHVGYYKREAADAKKRMDDCLRKLEICKERMRPAIKEIS
jgi:hypothetical protein